MPADLWRDPAAWPTWRQLLPHVLAVTDASRDLDPTRSVDVAWLLDCAATYLHTRGEQRRARPLFERAFELRQRLLGDDHPATLDSANNIAVGLYMLGEHEPARQLHEDTLTRCRRGLGDDHPATLRSATNLAAALRELGEHEGAHELDDWIRAQREQ